MAKKTYEQWRRSCVRKKKYHTKSSAEIDADRVAKKAWETQEKDIALDVYVCGYCDKYHVGKVASRKKKAERGPLHEYRKLEPPSDE